MQDPFDETVRELAPRSVLPIVVGANLEAELMDRGVASELRDAIRTAQDRTVPSGALQPVVLSDLWYLNDPPLRVQPTIAVGRPEINAATAFLAARIPTAFMVDGTFRVQLDPELVELNACLWGSDARSTAEAVACFIDRYLPDYLRSVNLLSPAAGA